jgi:hypothetical protein
MVANCYLGCLEDEFLRFLIKYTSYIELTLWWRVFESAHFRVIKFRRGCMGINKLLALLGIAMALSTGVSQAAVTTANVGVSAIVSPTTTVCTMSTPATVAMGAVVAGVRSFSYLNAIATCTSLAPYSYSFSSATGGAAGKMVSGTCSLNYNVVSYTTNGGAFGAIDYLTTPAPGGTGNGLAQTTNFALVVPAAQPGCNLAANSAALTVTDTLIVNINY